MKTVVIREHARLTTSLVEQTLDQVTITNSAFDWLCALAAKFGKKGASIVQVEDRQWLRWNNYVGIIETPCGTLIEVLPKHTDDITDSTVGTTRKLLVKMLTKVLDIPVRSADESLLHTFHHPLLEWVMKQFVTSLDHLIKQGIRFDYERIEDDQLFLRGQLNIARLIRRAPGNEHIFPIRYDAYLPNRPENRLLKSALIRVCRLTRHDKTWRLSHELAELLREIPESKSIETDFRYWQHDRLMAHYKPVHPWCELVLGQHMPLALRGKTRGISFLYPMEKLFERYVEHILRKQISKPNYLKSQSTSQSLCNHNGKKIFQLRPDFIIERDNAAVMLFDAKWKMASSDSLESKYDLSQSDFYQLFAYGHKYLNGVGKMMLVYPKTKRFAMALPSFDYRPELRLWITPFDLDNDILEWPIECQNTVFPIYS